MAEIIIQKIDENSITLNINGEIKEIQNQLSELRNLLKGFKTPTIQYAEKIYNIEHIDEANFGLLTNKPRLNLSLTYKLVKKLSEYDNAEMKVFIKKQSDDSWTLDIKNIREAQNIIIKGFGNIIGRSLQRLFNVGSVKQVDEDTYISQCQVVYKLCLQLTCFALLSIILDHQDKITGSFHKLKEWLESGTKLKLSEWRELLKELIDICIKDRIANIFTGLEVEQFVKHLEKNTEFYEACLGMEAISTIDEQGIEKCLKAEKYLTTILSIFSFWSIHKLVSVKDVKLVKFKKEEPQYIKNIQILGLESSNQVFKLDDKPIDAFSIFMQNSTTLINLSPFVIDFNAFHNHQEALLSVFESYRTDGRFEFFVIETETHNYLKYENVLGEKQTFKATQEVEVKQDNLFKLIRKIFENLKVQLPNDSISVDEDISNV
jgi:hypothetical protein